MSNSTQSCNDLIKSLITATGSYQDAMFLYLTILMSENAEVGLYVSMYSLESKSQGFNIIGVLAPKDPSIIEIYVINTRTSFSSGCPSAGVSSEMNSNDNLFISTYQKNEEGEWYLIKKIEESGKPSRETIWKKY